MPWVLSVPALLIVFVVAFVLGMGWTLGCWLMANIVGRIHSAPPK